MSDNQALVSIPKAEYQAYKNLNHEREYGTATKAPFFANTDDYAGWRRRFRIFISGWEPKLLNCYEIAYTWPKDQRNVDKDLSAMVDNEKVNCENEMKAYATLCQSIPKELEYLIDQHTVAAALWGALEKKFTGNEVMRKIEGEDLKREYDNFCSYKDESLTEMLDRFWKLISKLSQYEIYPDQTDMIDHIVVALPEQWTSLLSNMRARGDLSGMTATAFVDKLKEEEYHERRSLKQRQRSQQSGFGNATGTSSGVPLRSSGLAANIASPAPSTSTSTSTPPCTASSFKAPGTSSGAGASQQPSFDISGLKTDNINRIPEQELRNKLEMFGSFINSFDALLAGRIGNPDMSTEDCFQADEDEIERMDLEWQMAMITYRANKFQRKTGKRLDYTSKTRLGFDISKVRCHRCKTLGHFMKDCPEPATPSNNVKIQDADHPKAIANLSSTSGSQAFNAVFSDEGIPGNIDWDSCNGSQFKTLMATIVEESTEETVEVDESFSTAIAEQILAEVERLSDDEEESARQEATRKGAELLKQIEKKPSTAAVPAQQDTTVSSFMAVRS